MLILPATRPPRCAVVPRTTASPAQLRRRAAPHQPRRMLADASPTSSITLTAGPDDGAPAALMTWLAGKGLPLGAVEPGAGGGLVTTRAVKAGEVRELAERGGNRTPTKTSPVFLSSSSLGRP